MRLWALVYLAAVAAGACGGSSGGELTLQEYFTEFLALSEVKNETIFGLPEPRINDDDALEDSEREGLLDYFNAEIQTVRDFRDGIDGLQPPSELRGAHDEFVTGFSALVEYWESLVPLLENASTFPEAEELGQSAFIGQEADSIFARIRAACDTVQQVADANEVEADLTCEQWPVEA
jgi:hypothetical protein